MMTVREDGRVGPAPVTVVPRAHDLVLWLVPRVNEFPRAQRFVLGDRIETTRSPACRGDPRRAPDVHDPFPVREGRRKPDGSPRGRRAAEARRPGFIEMAAQITRVLRAAVVTGVIAAASGAAAALAAGTGEGVSAPFALYLGPGYAPPPTGDGVGSAESQAFALYLGPGYAAGGGVGSAVSPAFELSLNRSVSATVTSAGGTVSTPDNSVLMTFPPGAVSLPTPIAINDSGQGTLFELSTSSGRGTALFAVIIEPAGFVFNVPITIRLTWADADNDGLVDGTNIREDNLIVFKDGAAVSDRCRNESRCNQSADVFDVQVNSLSQFAIVDLPVPMGFVFGPGTLNLRSMGRWVKGCLEPPAGFEASAIDVGSIRLNGSVSVDSTGPATIGDDDGDGVPDLSVKFDRAAVELSVATGDSVAMTVTGMIAGLPFRGTAVIRVRRASVTAPVAGTVVTSGEGLSVRWETPNGVTIRSVALLSSADDGANWTLEATGIPNDGSYDWTVTIPCAEQAKVAIVLVESADSTGYLVEGVLGVSETFTVEGVVGVGDRPAAPLALAIRGARPNPAAAGRFWVEFSLRDGSPARLELMDVAGRVLSTREVGSLGAGPHALDLSEGGRLPSGVYFLRLTQGGGEVRARAAVVR